MNKIVKTLSPAKINLMLRVLGQREDGYHLLQTYFQILDWGDTMSFSPNKKDEVIISGEFGNLPQKDNLIDKAVNLLLPYRNNAYGLNIKVEKIIPQGSGLGGGSSNAGTTLRVINQLWECNLPTTKLRELALTLGADVPIFVFNQSAMAYGVGEKLQAYTIKPYWFVLLFPEASITTAEIFKQAKLKRNEKTIEIDLVNNKKTWTNTCLEIVLEKYPEVKSLYEEATIYSKVYMSGTGSTLFSCFDSEQEAKQFIVQLPEDVRSIICKAKINEKKHK